MAAAASSSSHDAYRETSGLHRAAMRANEWAVTQLLDEGADINALDATGRNVITCALFGECWEDVDASDAFFMSAGRLNVLRILVRHPEISLSTLNATQRVLEGATPLYMAVRLGLTEAVNVLLSESAGAVSVDGMSMLGETALMRAARDANIPLVQLLLSYGARPDLRDGTQRTALQYAIKHPQGLWLCETVLRRHRSRELQVPNTRPPYVNRHPLIQLASTSLLPAGTFTPPPFNLFASTSTESNRLTQMIHDAIRLPSLSFLHSILFTTPPSPSSPGYLYPMGSPVLVNGRDQKGWSPVHHCCAHHRPDVDVLDALYAAAADMSMHTREEGWTPAHVLAHAAKPSLLGDTTLYGDGGAKSMLLYNFAKHLVLDLRLPMMAKDKEGETCIHAAAEYGESLDVLVAFLECDKTGFVQGMRNSRGLTPLQVARPEFLVAFGVEAHPHGLMHQASTLSNRTIRPFPSSSSIATQHLTVPEWRSLSRQPTLQQNSPDLHNIDILTVTNQLLTNLRATCTTAPQNQSDLAHFESILRDSSQFGQHITSHFRKCSQDAKGELQSVKELLGQVDILFKYVRQTAERRLQERELEPFVRGQNGPPHPMAIVGKGRESEDSQITAVSSPISLNSKWHYSGEPDVHKGNPSKMQYNARLSRMLEAHEFKGAMDGIAAWTRTSGTPKKAVLKKKHVPEHRSPVKTSSPAKEDGVGSKFRSWFSRKGTKQESPHAHAHVDLHDDEDDDWDFGGRQRSPSVDGELFTPRHSEDFNDGEEDEPEVDPELAINNVLRSAHFVFAVAVRDLAEIRYCLQEAEHLIEASSESIIKAERILRRSMEKRRDVLNEIKAASRGNTSAPFLLAPRATHVKSTSSSSTQSLTRQRSDTLDSEDTVVSVTSFGSSCVSLLAEGDDEAIRALKRLLQRKINALLGGASEEIKQAKEWIQIVQECSRDVKRRAYL